MNEDRLKEIEARFRGWQSCEPGTEIGLRVTGPSVDGRMVLLVVFLNQENRAGSDISLQRLANFAASAPADLAALLAEVRLLRGIVADMRLESNQYHAGLEQGRKEGAEAERKRHKPSIMQSITLPSRDPVAGLDFPGGQEYQGSVEVYDRDLLDDEARTMQEAGDRLRRDAAHVLSRSVKDGRWYAIRLRMQLRPRSIEDTRQRRREAIMRMRVVPLDGGGLSSQGDGL